MKFDHTEYTGPEISFKKVDKRKKHELKYILYSPKM